MASEVGDMSQTDIQTNKSRNVRVGCQKAMEQ